MNTPMMEAARQAPHAMGSMMNTMGGMASRPLASGAMLAAGGYAAGRGLLGAGFGLLRNPLMFLAAGLTAGYLLHKYEKEIVAAVSQATGMGQDFLLHQKENLDDLVASAQSGAAAPTQSPTTPDGN
jgi:hypothetical protein